MNKAQARALVNLQFASGVLSVTVRCGEIEGDWFVRVLFRDGQQTTTDFCAALTLLSQLLKERTP